MTPPNPAHRATAGWRALVPVTLIILAGLPTIDCGDGTASSAGATPAARTTRSSSEAAQAAPSLCVSSPTQQSDRFGRVHGYIAFTAGTEIWASDPNHPDNRVSLGPSDGVSSMAWSRTGSRLLITEASGTGDAGVKQDLCVMNADGSATRLTSDGHSGVGSFSPDGAKVVYARVDDGLYVIDSNGGTSRLIARSYMAWWLGSPSWSPDGSRIAYSVYLEGGPDPGIELWTVRPDGTDPRPLLHMAQCRAARDVGWSPDASMLAFVTGCGQGGSALYVVRADGSGLRQTNDGGGAASWSPDGSRIAFIRDSGLFTMAADGSDVSQIEGTFANAYAGLAWNPVVRT